MRTFVKGRWYLIPPIILIALFAFSYLTMALWNVLMPGIFHLPIITFWQAVGLLILSRLFFGGSHWNRGMHHHPWRNNIRDKWEKMTPEEREQFRNKWHCHGHSWDYCNEDYKNKEKQDAPSV